MSFKIFFDKTCTLSKGEKGIEFEKYCKNYLEKSEKKKVYMYSEYVQKNTCLPKDDCGADLIIENANGSIQIVQCKFRKNIKKKISEKDIATTFVFAEKIKNCITYPIIIMSTSIDHADFFNDMKDVKFYHWDLFELEDKAIKQQTNVPEISNDKTIPINNFKNKWGKKLSTEVKPKDKTDLIKKLPKDVYNKKTNDNKKTSQKPPTRGVGSNMAPSYKYKPNVANSMKELEIKEIKKEKEIKKKSGISDDEKYNIRLSKISNEGNSTDFNIGKTIKKIIKLNKKYPNNNMTIGEYWTPRASIRAPLYLEIVKTGKLKKLPNELFQYEKKAFSEYLKDK